MLRIISQMLFTDALGVSFTPWFATAGHNTFNFTGTVTQAPIDDFGLGIQPMDAITGAFTFDSGAVEVHGVITSLSCGGAAVYRRRRSRLPVCR